MKAAEPSDLIMRAFSSPTLNFIAPPLGPLPRTSSKLYFFLTAESRRLITFSSGIPRSLDIPACLPGAALTT